MSSSSRAKVLGNTLGLGLGVAAIFGATAMFYSAKIKVTERVCTLSNTAGERVTKDGGSKFLIYTKDCGTFENTDYLLRGKFNSSDVQSVAYNNAGKKVAVRSTGWRAGFFSWYPNVITLKPQG